MGEIIVNPGTEQIKEEVSYENALNNMQVFISDLDIPYMILRSVHVPDADGYYEFVIKSRFYDEITIGMPGLPLEQVRYVEDKGQNPYDFQRLYVDGSSWLWNISVEVCSKEGVIECLLEDIDTLEYQIRKLRETFKELKDYK